MTKTIKDLEFVKEITVGVIRKIEKYSKQLQKEEIGELDFIALTFNYYLTNETMFDSNEEAEKFFDALNTEQLGELQVKMSVLNEVNKKK
ncbi:MAG: hypothetical protein PF569_04735 [Candidatus Woesearchaeota archaeon]|jgi:hypothetical protein|nr:hypothetical protein [Candidatus Woesearchaeota archaeon]